MACKHCGLSDNSLLILVDIDSLPSSGEDLWGIVDAEITRVETLLNRLILNRSLLKRKINHHSSPLLRIPSDITSEIFKAYLHEEVETTSGRVKPQGALVPPLLIGGVCSAWRDLAWSMPWIWSSITLRLSNLSRNCATFVDEWLSRSGQSALNITISILSDLYRREHHDSMLEVLRVVAHFSERWRHITLNLPLLACYDALRSVQGCVPLLESVFMSCEEDQVGEDHLRMFSVAPQLRVVHCEGFPQQNITLPLSQLVSLSEYQCDVLHCLEVFEVASQLTRAEFRITISERDLLALPRSNPHLAFAPHLQSLTLYVARFGFILLDNVTLPGLRQMSFRNSEDSCPTFRHLKFPPFILRSACLLQSLSIGRFRLDDEALLHCMQAVPSLTELTIESSEVTNQTIRNLQVTPNTTSIIPLLPNLKILSITSSTLIVNAFDLYSMVCARRGQTGAGSGCEVVRLKSVTVSCDKIAEDTRGLGIPLLHELVKEGIDIQIDPSP